MTIWKFELQIADFTSIVAPLGARIIHVGLDPAGKPSVWAECNPGNSPRKILLCVVATGAPKPDEAVNHVGSFVRGPFVHHVYST